MKKITGTPMPKDLEKFEIDGVRYIYWEGDGWMGICKDEICAYPITKAHRDAVMGAWKEAHL